MNAGGGASRPNDVRAKIEAIAEAEKRQREKAEAAKKASEKAAEIVKARTTITGDASYRAACRRRPTKPATRTRQDDRTLRFGSDEPHYTGDAISCCNVTWHTVRETTTSPLKVTMADTSPGPRNRVVVRPNADG